MNNINLCHLCQTYILEQIMCCGLFGTEWLIPGALDEITATSCTDSTALFMSWEHLKASDKQMGC